MGLTGLKTESVRATMEMQILTQWAWGCPVLDQLQEMSKLLVAGNQTTLGIARD